MHPQSPQLTIGGALLKQSNDHVILVVTLNFDSEMTFEKHLRLVSSAASQILGILKKSWPVSHDITLFERCFRVICAARFGVRFCSVVLGCQYRPETTGPCSQ